MKAQAVADQMEVEFAMRDLEGVAALLLDASRRNDPDGTGVTTAARFLEDIHRRLLAALGQAEGGQ